MRTRPRFAYSVPKIGKGSFYPHRSFLCLLSGRAAPTSITSGVRPSLCPGPMLQGVYYVQVSVVYIRNIMPIRAPAGLSRVQSKPLPGRARISHPTARPDLFLPNVGEEEFCEVRGCKLPNSGRVLWRQGGAGQGFCCLLAPRWPHLWRGIVASGHRLWHSNFLRILGPLYPTPQVSPRPPYALLNLYRSGVGLTPSLLLDRLRLHLLLPLFLPDLLQQPPPIISDSEQ